MKRLVAVCVALVLAFVQAACTPKPASAQPVAQAVLDALVDDDMDALASHVDQPGPATDAASRSIEGLQADSLEASNLEVAQDGAQATATYTLTWHLPRERDFSYDAQMILTQTEGEWTARWQPTLLHPDLGANQYLELRGIDARPASIVSSDGADLMRPGTVHRVIVDTDAMTSADRTAEAIRRALTAAHERDESVTVPGDDLAADLQAASGSYSVTTVPEREGEAVAADLAGSPEVRLNEEAAMVAVDPGFAPDTMARVGQIVADRLEGERGWHVVAVNEHGAALADIERHDPTPAPAITVSLDYDVQRAAETAVNEMGDRQAVVVAVRPSTGQVLAVAQSAAADRDGNIGLIGQYPPGSTFKIITASAGVQDQGLQPDTIVGCPSTQDLYGRVVTNYNGFSLGNVPLQNAFAQSCNTTFADISTNLEPGQLEHMAKQFGLGVNYDIPGLDTITGSVPFGETPLERTEAGYGQGYDLASPFGMAMVSATAAAGRTPVPVLIDGEETTVDETVEPPAPETIASLQQMMRAVVTDGTARGMSAGGEIHGKTGEAEISGGSHAWFTGYRDDDIAFATLVVLGGGSEIAVATTDRFFITLDELRAQ